MTARKFAISFAAAVATCLCMNAQADDIDVFRAKIANQKKPNILFVLDYSGSMADDINGRDPGSSGKTAKIDILKKAMNQILDENTDRINAGIGSLYSNTTTGIRWPISELNADAHSVDPAIPPGKFTVSDIIKKQIAERDADGYTATVDALVEAAQYFRGDKVTHNDASQSPSRRHKPDTWNTNKNRYNRGNPNAALAASYSPSDAYSKSSSATFYCNDYSQSGGPNYCEDKRTSACTAKSPSDNTTAGFDRLNNLWGNYTRCEYRRDYSWEGARYNSPISQSCQANAIVLISDGEPTRISNGESLRSIVGTDISGCEDLSTSVFGRNKGKAVNGNCGIEVLKALSGSNQNPNIPKSQVKTYTIGFNTKGAGKRYLNKLATAGDGKFFQADSPEQLSDALAASVEEALGGSENFAELAIDVNKANFAHDNRVFFSLFKPTVSRAWNGNLKGYFITREGLTDINGQKATISTAQGEQFVDSAQSFWSAKPDGNDVLNGGASSRLRANNRTLYTYTRAKVPQGGVRLNSSDSYRLDKSNGKLTDALLGINNSSVSRTQLLDWIQQAPMGDPLHSRSVIVNYGNRQVAFISTNQGLMHAFDASDPIDEKTGNTSGGKELYAFMPRRLLQNLPHLQTNTNITGHIYGLDGAITRWHDDDNNDGIVNNNEKVLLVFGMRRGGKAYYALDVSQWNSPKLEWIIDNTHPDFQSMAQSWSRMSLINVNNKGKSEKVLAFSAGYDASVQDSANSPTASSGNAIYMINRKGQRVWKADRSNHAAMQFSIPSDLTVIDSDGDKIADRLYVGDVGGQLWRVDFHDINKAPNVTVLAELNNKSHQPFFYPPSVAMNRTAQGDFLSIAIGSGNRTNPLLNTAQNYLYMIRDTDTGKSAASKNFDTVTPDELYDVTNNTIEASDPDKAKAARSALKKARGWILKLEENEKALSSVVSFEGKLLATTFKAELASGSDQCGYDTTGRYYAMNLVDARPIISSSNNSNSSNPLPLRGQRLQSSGIPSSPVVIFPKGSSAVQVIVDKEPVDRFEQRLSRVYWHAK